MSTTKDENPDEIYQWHIVIQKRDDRFIMRLLGGIDDPDLTEFLLKQQSKAS